LPLFALLLILASPFLEFEFCACGAGRNAEAHRQGRKANDASTFKAEKQAKEI